ncbi:MAG: magnesium/cobalt transporter CorA [Bacteroidia bacterium]|nr:magnesium/cobalt transporter CorA [Bacteroidia bacterium]
MQRKKSKTGFDPGTLVYRGKEHPEGKGIHISRMSYNSEELEEKAFSQLSDCLEDLKKGNITWINVDGVHKTEVIESVGEKFRIHPLTLEDIVNTEQRPKFEDYGHYILCVLHMMHYEHRVVSEQLSILVFENLVITFQEADGGDAFDYIRTRLRQNKGKIRKMGSDYLAYSLLDAVVDTYFTILEKIGDRIEVLEESLVAQPKDITLHQLHSLKREMIFLRKGVWPLRELLNNMERSESELITKTTDLYLRDLYDHTIRVIDTVETYRDLLSGMMDIYLSSLSNKMNQVMKVLTIISTLFIPVTFIAGIYGMNFRYMPELASPNGYWITLVLMGSIIVGLLFWFRYKKWL